MSDRALARGAGAKRRRAPVREALIVSPPVTPPWLNGTAVLARELAVGGVDFRYRVMGVKHQAPPGGTTVVEPLYRAGDPHGRSTWSRLRVMARLVQPDRCALHHFIFAPHPRAVQAFRGALKVSRKPSLHTIPSRPPDAELRADRLARLMFADRVVASSEATALLLRSAGVGPVRVIRPSVPLPPAPADRAAARRTLAAVGIGAAWGDAPVFLYPGDLEFSDGSRAFVEAALAAAGAVPEARFALACRAKTPASREALTEVRRRVAGVGLGARFDFLGVVPDMAALLGAVDAVVMVVDTLYAKVDTPLVLLEAMAAGRPLIVSDLPALGELAGLGPGVDVVPRSDPSALAAAILRHAAAPPADGLAQALRATVAARFSRQRMVAEYESLYRELLGDG